MRDGGRGVQVLGRAGDAQRGDGCLVNVLGRHVRLGAQMGGMGNEDQIEISDREIWDEEQGAKSAL